MKSAVVHSLFAKDEHKAGVAVVVPEQELTYV